MTSNLARRTAIVLAGQHADTGRVHAWLRRVSKYDDRYGLIMSTRLVLDDQPVLNRRSEKSNNSHDCRDQAAIGTIMLTTVERLRKSMTTALAVVWVLLAIVTDARWTAEGTLLGVTLFVVGCLFVSVGVIGRVWCLSHIAGHKGETLVVDGPYSLCRNPLYLFSLIGAVGVGLASRTLTLPLLVILGFGLYYPWVIMSEANRLAAIFGDAFHSYRRSTGAFLPKFRNFRESPQQSIQNRAFRRGLFESVWFFATFALMHALYELHQSGLVPVSFTLP